MTTLRLVSKNYWTKQKAHFIFINSATCLLPTFHKTHVHMYVGVDICDFRNEENGKGGLDGLGFNETIHRQTQRLMFPPDIMS